MTKYIFSVSAVLLVEYCYIFVVFLLHPSVTVTRLLVLASVAIKCCISNMNESDAMLYVAPFLILLLAVLASSMYVAH